MATSSGSQNLNLKQKISNTWRLICVLHVDAAAKAQQLKIWINQDSIFMLITMVIMNIATAMNIITNMIMTTNTNTAMNIIMIMDRNMIILINQLDSPNE